MWLIRSIWRPFSASLWWWVPRVKTRLKPWAESSSPFGANSPTLPPDNVQTPGPGFTPGNSPTLMSSEGAGRYGGNRLRTAGLHRAHISSPFRAERLFRLPRVNPGLSFFAPSGSMTGAKHIHAISGTEHSLGRPLDPGFSNQKSFLLQAHGALLKKVFEILRFVTKRRGNNQEFRLRLLVEIVFDRGGHAS